MSRQEAFSEGQGKRILFHGTGYTRPDEILAAGQFTPSRMGESGPGVYLTKDRWYAERLASNKANRTVFTVEADIRNPLVRRPEDPDDPGEREYRELQQQHPPYRDSNAFLGALQGRGYDAVETFFRNGGVHEVAVHDTAKLRILRHDPVEYP